MLNKIRKLQNKKGFTLVELIVVIAIIAILTAVIVPLVSRYTTQATYTSLQSAASSVETQVNAAINSYAATGKVFGGKTVIGVCDGNGTPLTIYVDKKAITVTHNADNTYTTTEADTGLKKLAESIATGLATKFPANAAFGVIVQNGGVVGTVYCPSPDTTTYATSYGLPLGSIASVNGYDDAYTINSVACGILGTIKASADDSKSLAYDTTTGVLSV